MRHLAQMILWVLACFWAGACDKTPPPEPQGPPVTAFSLQAGKGLRMDICSVGPNSYTFRFYGKQEVYVPEEEAPVVLEVYPRGDGSATWSRSTYQEARLEGGKAVALAHLTTPAGSEFRVQDTYIPDPERGIFRLEREVEVLKAQDRAFNSYFMLRNQRDAATDAYEYFIPSLVYQNAQNLPSAAIGSDFSHEWILAREERMGLPLAMFRRIEGGESLALCDYNLEPRTFREDMGLNHFVNAEMRFGSLGFHHGPGGPALVYCYPGSEGERTYADGGSRKEKRWARRSHPVREAFTQQYTLEIQCYNRELFPRALEAHWKAAFALYNPEILELDNSVVLDNGIQLLGKYWLIDGQAPGFPFSVHLPGGAVKDVSFDMGFVGMQIPCAYYLYRYGVENGLADYSAQGEQILDFWARNSAAPNGMPRTWWDISPWHSFRNNNDLRTMQGGMEAMILAWGFAQRQQAGSKGFWLDYCKGAADWLVSIQQIDGSWPKSFDSQGRATDTGTLLTSNVIRFLSAMYAATSDSRYREAALRAGAYCLRELHEPYRYVGSVVDNPYIKDRESGQKCLEAFLALYDLSGDPQWIDCASQAAYYTATYMYAWNIPRPQGNVRMAWDDAKTTVGITIIATGHSGADCGFSYNSYEFFRLYVLTGDPCFLHIARLLEKNTKQTLDFDGSLGYAHPGLQTEALRVVTPWGDNVNVWLPWITASALDPLYRLRDTYQDIEIGRLALRPREELQDLDARRAATQGIFINPI